MPIKQIIVRSFLSWLTLPLLAALVLFIWYQPDFLQHWSTKGLLSAFALVGWGVANLVIWAAPA